MKMAADAKVPDPRRSNPRPLLMVTSQLTKLKTFLRITVRIHIYNPLLNRTSVGLLWMINQLEQNLEKFKPAEMWKPGYYQWLLDFLDENDNRKIFFWVENDDISISIANPPKYYGKFNGHNVGFKARVFSLQIQI